jgi:hypothetical protein
LKERTREETVIALIYGYSHPSPHISPSSPGSSP